MLGLALEILRERFLPPTVAFVDEGVEGAGIATQSADLPSERRAPRSSCTERTAWPYSGSGAVTCSAGLLGRRTVPAGASGTPLAAAANKRFSIQLLRTDMLVVIRVTATDEREIFTCLPLVKPGVAAI